MQQLAYFVGGCAAVAALVSWWYYREGYDYDPIGKVWTKRKNFKPKP